MRFIINWAIKTGLVLLFSLFGWITLLSEGKPATSITWQITGVAALIAIVFTLANILVKLVWLLLGALSAGIILILGIILYPILGWIALTLAAAWAPSFIALHSFWLTLLCGYALMIAKLPSPKKPRSESNQVRPLVHPTPRF